MIRRSVLVVLFVAITFSLIGCGKGKVRYGEAIPGNVKVVELKEIVEYPEEYKDKEVVLEGNYGGYCCASDFVYKEGLESVEVHPEGFPTPKLVIGKPIRVYGVVRSIEKRTKSEDVEEKGEEHHEIYIEAKGVEVK